MTKMTPTHTPGCAYEPARWEGWVQAETGISHGGENLGQVQYLRRERILTPQGVTEIPIVSGNSARGRLRDIAAELWWGDAGRPALPLAVTHAVFSGGALTKTVGEPLSGERLRKAKHVCPVLDVFGAAGGGRIINGKANVGKMVPICTETAHMVPEQYLPEDTLPDLWDIVNIEWYSRRGDPDGHPPGRYGVETFIAGTRFHWWVTLDDATERTLSFFTDTLAAYSTPGSARVGGNVRIGLGRLEVHIQHVRGVTPTAGCWRRDGAPFTGEEIETLSWIG